MKLSLKKTIYIGYVTMILFVLFMGVFSINSVNLLKKAFDNVINAEINLAEHIGKLSDILVMQSLSEKIYFTLNIQEAEQTFWLKSKEFNRLIHAVEQEKALPANESSMLFKLHQEYDDLFKQQVESMKKKHFDEAKTISAKMQHIKKQMLTYIRDMNIKVTVQKESNITHSTDIIEYTRFIAILIISTASLFALAFAFFFSNYLSGSIEKFKSATDSIKKGHYDKFPSVGGINEFADLAVSFQEMSARLKELEAMHLDANPLTKLPGNLAIEKELLIRFKEGLFFSFCLLDIDNFKAYSDKYGYSKGSDVLQWLGYLIKNSVELYGISSDFVGHIGGDDFVLISVPNRVRELCKKIIEQFDLAVKSFYNAEDQANGYIISVDRQNQMMKFPIMTLSIAIVSNDTRPIADPKEVAERLADLKQYAKTFPKSIYIFEKRREKHD
jgi:diguanylate cyclase (GGDEF)-like protein